MRSVGDSVRGGNQNSPASADQPASKNSIAFFPFQGDSAEQKAEASRIKDHHAHPGRESSPTVVEEKTHSHDHACNSDDGQPLRPQHFLKGAFGFSHHGLNNSAGRRSSCGVRNSM